MDKAGLLDLESSTLYGALLSLRDGAGDKAQLNKWEALRRAHLRPRGPFDEGKEAVVLSFPATLGKDATAPLRAAGFRFNQVLQHWEGLAGFADAEALAKEHGGAARRYLPCPACLCAGAGIRRGVIAVGTLVRRVA